MSFRGGDCRYVAACGIVLFAVSSFAGQPVPAVLSDVELAISGPGEIGIELRVRGRIDRVETMSLGDGRFVLDLTPVVWDGPSRRVRPGPGGVREYRWSQFSRDPSIARFVVEAAGGWACRHEPAPQGLLILCSGPPEVATGATLSPGPDVAVVRGIGLASPIEGLDADGLVDRSLAYLPRDVVRDGLPNFGAVRDDWLGTPRSHKGLDIYGDKVGVRAAASGRVAGAGDGEKAGGWVKISHGNGVETVYVHVGRPVVAVGDEVVKGQRIAFIDGAAGNAIEPQLHFELKLDGRSVDVVPFLFEAASEGLRTRISEALRKLAIRAQEREAKVRQGNK